jgi:hypothetical protein
VPLSDSCPPPSRRASRTGASGVAKAGARRRFSNLEPQGLCHQVAQIDGRRSVGEPHFDADVNILGSIRMA